MTIKDIFDTPISELWEMASGFVTDYLIFYYIFFLLVASLIMYASFNVFNRHKKFNKKRNRNKRR